MTARLEGMPQDLLVRILIGAEKLDSVIVGGQALNIWGERYYERAQTDLEAFRPFVSKDIDFLGTAAEARSLADFLKGELRIPGGEDFVTPNTAAVSVELGGETYLIDFLYAAAGLKPTILRRRAQLLEIQVMDETVGSRRINVRVLHPMDVLLSRSAGIILLGREDTGALRQMAAAPIVLREYIRDLLSLGEHQDIKEAQRIVREFIQTGGKQSNDLIFDRHGIDILAEAAKLADHPVWDQRFAKYQIKCRCKAESARRNRRIEEARRRLEHKGA